MSIFTEGRELPVESPQEGFYIRKVEGEKREIRLWEVHPETKIDPREETAHWIGVMTAGELEFWIGAERKNVFPSDIVRIPAHTPYRFRVVGERTARMVWIQSE